MATAADLYKMTPERSTKELSYLVGCYYNHIPEVGNDIESVKYLLSSDRVEIKFLKDWNFDFRRVWQLATVWFDGNPVMITQNAGRE